MISKHSKFIFVLLLVSVVLVSGCSQSPSNKPIDTNPNNSGTLIEDTKTEQPDDSTKVKEFSITAKQFEFQPSTITVKKGDHVKLTIKSIDVTHGFALPDFGVTAQLEPNKQTVVEFTPTKKGTFTFFCNNFCGSGHSSMKGTLVVEE